MDATIEVTSAQLRRWLELLNQPHRLDDPFLKRLLQAHDRLPSAASPMVIGRATADLLRDTIRKLDAGPHASRQERFPFLVLETCFLQGRKLFQAAGELGVSERHLTRERARAISLLQAELQAPITSRFTYPLEPLPDPPQDFIERPGAAPRLEMILQGTRDVRVVGGSGVGKTTAVAAAARSQSSHNVFWITLRAGINDNLRALLFELGEYLDRHSCGELAGLTRQISFDVKLATRLALLGLNAGPHLLVFDNYDLAQPDGAVNEFIDEVLWRLGHVQVARIGSDLEGPPGSLVSVRPFNETETGSFLTYHRVKLSGAARARLFKATAGNPRALRNALMLLKVV